MIGFDPLFGQFFQLQLLSQAKFSSELVFLPENSYEG